jgi:hypothetical protein
MANPIKPKVGLLKHRVLKAYQCPNTKKWHAIDAEVELLPSEAQFLILSGHLDHGEVVASDKAKKGVN